MGLQVSTPKSDTAKFKMAASNSSRMAGAHVATEWIDVDETGTEHSDPIIWMARLDNGWRIAGMATEVFEDQPPLFLNFEDPEDMMRKQQLVGEEIHVRAKAAGGEVFEASAESVTAAPEKSTKKATRR